MTRKYLFADESGNFDFSPKGTKYFILVSVGMECSVGDAVLSLRRDLAWEGIGLDHDFHASEAPWPIRNRVYDLLAGAAIQVDATILEKRKAYPGIRATEERFYQTAWYRHLRYVAPLAASPQDELMVVGASVGTNKRKTAFHSAISDVMKQVRPAAHRVACWGAAGDPCLQVADYCAWAIQRKWEKGDLACYDKIRSKVRSEFDLFRTGTLTYY